MRRSTPMTALIALAVLLASCTGVGSGQETTTRSLATTTTLTRLVTPHRVERSVNAVRASLVPFDACDDFLRYVTDHALELVGPYGLGGYGFYGPMPILAEDTAAATDGGAAAPSRSAPYSGTNLQEAGVDEADIVKTDGQRIVALAEQNLVVIDVTGDSPRLNGKLPLRDGYVTDMFLSGDRVLLIGGAYGDVFPLAGIRADAPQGHWSQTVTVIEVDISAGDPEVRRVLELDGRYVNSRMVGDTVRIVTASGPTGFDWAYPEGGGLRAERDAEEKNRELIEQSTIENWVPYFVLGDADGRSIAEGPLVACDRAHHPDEFSGFEMLNVLTIDIGRSLEVADATGILAGGETVYASTESLYVATSRWLPWWTFESELDAIREVDHMKTDIHLFDITTPDLTRYVASGEVEGYLLNQFAMSEHDGRLRVASTTAPGWWGWDGSGSESLVTVLEHRDSLLETVGVVDDLGRGERIYSVRFIGDTGYVVTFRQTDPLYTIDLSDPSNPVVRGELKILGYSAYLHPVGEDLLLGVGQDATETGRTLGTQVSLFDVSDPSDPRRVSGFALHDASSAAEYDHHAFLYWEDTGMAVIPVQRWHWSDRSGKEEVFVGAIGVQVSGDTVGEMARIVHPGGAGAGGYWDYRAQILRSIAIDDALYTISAKGILRSDLETLADEAWLEF